MAILWSSSVLTKLLIIILPVLRIQAAWTTDDEECRTPSKEMGGCVPIHECIPITSFLQQSVDSGHTDLSKDVIELLRSYQCGFQDSSIKVCCPKEIVLPQSFLNRFITNEDPPPPDVKNHRNLRLLPYNCGLPQTMDRISGGNKTYIGDFPWMVLINYATEKGFGFKCGATIINKRYILTAAHCITNLANLKLVSVRIGEYNMTSTNDCEVYPNGYTHCAPPVQDIRIEEVLPHPEFNPSEFLHDVGLLRLATPIDLSLENAKPICLPLTQSARNLNYTNTKLTITGWGLTEFGKVSDTLLQVNIPITSRSECQNAYLRSTAKISYLHICGGGKNRQDSCAGDSGGPLQKIENINSDPRYVQYGIVSFGGKTCGRVGVPGVYTRLDYYMKWILDSMKP